jgi:hypothetical protein
MLIHLPIVILTSLHPVAIADAVPQFDITRECQAEGGTKAMEQRCTADETHAREQLQAEWMQFGPSAKLQCKEEAGTDGTSSYVELQTCLEIERDVNTERDAKTPK